MSERLLKILVYVAGVICLYAFIAVRVPSMFNAVLKEKIIPEYWENTKYGELYYFNYIKHFREENLPGYSVKYRFTDRHPSLQEADVLLFGDSFFDFTRMTTFPERLSDSLNKRVFYARMDRPLTLLAENEYRNEEEKILLFESAERYIPTRFTTPHQLGHLADERSGVRKALANTRDVIFQDNTDALYSTLLSRNVLTCDLYSMAATMKFDVFGYITDMTPVYTLEEETPWVFYHDQLGDDPGSFYYQYSDDEINTYCDNMVDLSEKLYETYKLKMVFMAIPSKYTIYHDLINNDPYNDFLPRLYAGLEERGMPVIRLYEDFMESDELLYYGTDTHWRESGLDIALANTLDLFQSLTINY
ncbi:MAG: hypothetical protein CSA96_06640 [Bacteroidetes bacterium]|nr:MAG: hypothetical protein CSA96_06640 [Bacteroidota bacterium]